eukprot:COSAG02_NODE_46070_length_352_cov_0.584980_1_plen_68_part_01
MTDADYTSLLPEGTTIEVSLKRLLDESPWLQFTSECQRGFDPHRASITSRFGQAEQQLRTALGLCPPH